MLTGVSLGSYGHDLGLEHGLATLVAAILQETAVPRLRLSSVEPWDVDEALVSQWENPRLCRQLHVPLQSGCDAVLKRMGRRVTRRRIVDLLGRLFPIHAIEAGVEAMLLGDEVGGFANHGLALLRGHGG